MAKSREYSVEQHAHESPRQAEASEHMSLQHEMALRIQDGCSHLRMVLVLTPPQRSL